MTAVEKNLVRDVMTQPTNVIHPDETLEVANRVMSGQTVRSLIVVETNQPIGVVFISDVQGADPETPIRSVMHRDFPTLSADTTLNEARTALGEFDYDLLPVVDEQGVLIGEVPRQTVVHADHQVTSSREAANFDMPQSDGSTKPVTISPGMDVAGSGGSKLGTVDEILLEDNQPSGFTVKHGFISHKHKQFEIDLVDRIEDDTMILRIDKMEFKFMADIEDEE